MKHGPVVLFLIWVFSGLSCHGHEPVKIFPRYFIVGIPGVSHPEAFVVSLNECVQIELARSIIEGSVPQKIVSASVAPWRDNINRNYLLDGAPTWSWSVTSVLGFFDVSSVILNGSPSFVEEDVDGWMLQSGGQIGFWLYTIIGELPLQPTMFLSDGTRFSKVYEFYDERYYPWVNFYEHGWMYVFGFDPFDVWLWTKDMGFLWTSEKIYPFIYRDSDDTWLYFFDDHPFNTPRETPRTFFNFRTGEWEDHDPVR